MPTQTGAIDDLHRATSNASEPEKQEEGKKITSGLAALKYEVQHDRKLTYASSHYVDCSIDAHPTSRPIPDDGGPDIALYNKELEQRGSPNWFDVAWLYAECYLYRLVDEASNLAKEFH